jgi:hypothetical protein
MGIAVTILKYLKTRPSHPPTALVPASSQADQKSSPIKSAAGESTKKSNIATVAAIGFLPIKISFPPTPSFMTIVKKEEEESEGATIGEVERERDVVFFHCLPSSSGLVTQYQVSSSHSFHITSFSMPFLVHHAPFRTFRTGRLTDEITHFLSLYRIM